MTKKKDKLVTDWFERRIKTRINGMLMGVDKFGSSVKAMPIEGYKVFWSKGRTVAQADSKYVKHISFKARCKGQNGYFFRVFVQCLQSQNSNDQSSGLCCISLIVTQLVPEIHCFNGCNDKRRDVLCIYDTFDSFFPDLDAWKQKINTIAQAAGIPLER